MGVFGAVFWCRPENTTFLMVLPIETRGKYVKATTTRVSFLEGFSASVRAPCSSIFWDFWLVFFWFYFIFSSCLLCFVFSYFLFAPFFLLLPSFSSFIFPSSFFLHHLIFHISFSLVTSFSLGHSSCYYYSSVLIVMLVFFMFSFVVIVLLF